jgi:hypothetical protein
MGGKKTKQWTKGILNSVFRFIFNHLFFFFKNYGNAKPKQLKILHKGSITLLNEGHIN